MFFEDARVASRDLDLTLTARNRGEPDEVPLCGFPAHAAQPYVARLLAKGHTVAVCEQSPGRGRGLMEREVVRVITPGTILEEESLEQLRPPLDGNEVMEHLGVEPGRVVGEALDHLLELRIERGPIPKEEAFALLDAWAADRGLEAQR